MIKKEYKKPEAEIVEFVVTEKLMDLNIGGDENPGVEGTSVEDW